METFEQSESVFRVREQRMNRDLAESKGAMERLRIELLVK
jgi:hypothetical protein